MEHDWVILDDQVVFDAHGDYTPEILEEIVENNNRRIRDTGNEVPLILGHTKEGADEDDQPEIVGWACDFRVGMIGDENPRPAIFCRMKFYRDKFLMHDITRQYNRPSVEIWCEDKYIDPIALLGPTTPRRDLGHVGQKQKKYRYSMNTYLQGEQMEQKEDLLKDLMSKLEQHEVFAYVRALMKEAVKETEVNQLPDGGEEAEVDADRVDKDEQEDKDRLAKDNLTSEVEKFKRENSALRTEFDALQRKFRRAERERDLVRLESCEGISFDMTEELELVQEMSDEQYNKHRDRMRKRYQRAPINVNLNIAPLPDHGGERQFTMDDAYKAIELAQNKKISYEEAVNALKGGKLASK